MQWRVAFKIAGARWSSAESMSDRINVSIPRRIKEDVLGGKVGRDAID
jgi:hypothetical protein